MIYPAIVRFLSREEGGRLNPPQSGYKPHVKIGNEHTSCCITLKSDNVMQFGMDYEVDIEFQYGDRFAKEIKHGLNIGLYEGSKLVGHGYLK